jgi:hypothetical protein
MNRIVTAFVLLVAAACSDAPTSGSRADTCIAAFKAYDRSLTVNLGSIFRNLSAGSPTVRNEEALRETEAVIRQNGCLTTSADIPRLITPRRGMERNRAGDSGQFIRTQYMHVAITTDRNGARNLEQFFASLGYAVRVTQADRLGWRVFLGPLNSNGAVLSANKLMEQVPLDTWYIVNPGRT